MVTGQAETTALKVRTHATCARVVANRAASAPLPEPETVTQPAQPIRRFLKSINAHVRFLFTVCEDTDENCGYWATSGYCRHGYYGRFMMMNCRHSCNLCSSRTALPTQRKQNNSILYVMNDVTSWLSLQVVGTRTSVVCTGRPVENVSPILDTCFPTARSRAVFANKRWLQRRATCIERLV